MVSHHNYHKYWDITGYCSYSTVNISYATLSNFTFLLNGQRKGQIFFLLTHCILVDYSTVICWMSPFIILQVSVLFCHFYSIFDGKMENPVSKQCRPRSDATYVASDLGLHCLPMSLFTDFPVRMGQSFGRVILPREANGK